MVRGMKFPFEIGLFTQEENQAQLLQNQLNQELYQELLLGRQLSHTQKIHRARLYSKLKNPKLSEEQELRRQRAIQAVKEIREAAAENGVADMTLDEINEEIRLARQERKEREKENKENVENNANNKE